VQIFGQIVTFNNQDTICACIESILISDLQITLRVLDNASSDKTVQLIRENFPFIQLITNEINLGFAVPHNQGMSNAISERFKYYLCINPDLSFEKGCINEMHRALEIDNTALICTPKLVRGELSDNRILKTSKLDSTGIEINTEGRHFDRDHEREQSQMHRLEEYVFGSTGACFLIRTSFTEKLFDEDYFAYREDADLAYRLNYRGALCRFQATAVAIHLRKVSHLTRSQNSSFLNNLGVRNRFLLQMRSLPLLLLIHPNNILRNFLVVGGVLVKERNSITGLVEAIKLAPKSVRARLHNFRHRSAGWPLIFSWIKNSSKPALPLDNLKSAETRQINVIIIDFNSGDLLIKCIKSILDSTETKNFLVHVVINGDNQITNLDPRVSVLSSGQNLGFAGGVNKALQLGGYTLILNPDIEIDSRSILQLAKTLDEYPELVGAAPILIDSAGYPQYGFLAKRLPTFCTFASEFLGLHRLFPNGDLNKYLSYTDYIQYFNDTSNQYPVIVEQPAGACLMLRADIAKSLGGFDTGFYPAWFEDVDFCKRAIKENKLFAIQRSAVAKHLGGYSKNVLGEEKFLIIYIANLFRYINIHHSRLELFVLKIIFGFGIILRCVIFLIMLNPKKSLAYLDGLKVLFKMKY